MPANPPKEIICFHCGGRVPRKELTSFAVKFGKGLCSKKCSKAMRAKCWAASFCNRFGRMKFREHRKDYKSKKEILASSFNVHF